MVALSPGPIWRIAPGGVTKVYLNRVLPAGRAAISGKGKTGWARNQIIVSLCDLFHERADAQHEWRHRRAENTKLTFDPCRGPINYKPSAAELRDGDAAHWATRQIAGSGEALAAGGGR